MNYYPPYPSLPLFHPVSATLLITRSERSPDSVIITTPSIDISPLKYLFLQRSELHPLQHLLHQRKDLALTHP